MKKIILAAFVGIFFAACGSKQEVKTVADQAQAYAQQMDEAIQAGDTVAARSLAEEIVTWHEGLSADDQLKVAAVTDVDEVIAKAESAFNVSLTDAAKQAVEQLTDAATAAEGVAEEAKAAGQQAVDAAKAAGKQTVDAAKAAGKATVDAAKEQGKAAINAAAQKGADAINNAAKKGAEAINSAAQKTSKQLGL